MLKSAQRHHRRNAPVSSQGEHLLSLCRQSSFTRVTALKVTEGWRLNLHLRLNSGGTTAYKSSLDLGRLLFFALFRLINPLLSLIGVEYIV